MLAYFLLHLYCPHRNQQQKKIGPQMSSNSHHWSGTYLRICVYYVVNVLPESRSRFYYFRLLLFSNIFHIFYWLEAAAFKVTRSSTDQLVRDKKGQKNLLMLLTFFSHRRKRLSFSSSSSSSSSWLDWNSVKSWEHSDVVVIICQSGSAANSWHLM